jgi:hypothetical protein
MELIKVKNNTPSFLHISSLNKSLSPGQTLHLTKTVLETNMEVIDCLANGWLVECKNEEAPVKKEEVVTQPKVSVETQAKMDLEKQKAETERSEACVMTPGGPKKAKMRNFTAEMGLPTFVDEEAVITEEDPDLANMQAETVAIGQIKPVPATEDIAADAGLESLDGEGSNYSTAFLDDFKGGHNGQSEAFVDEGSVSNDKTV